MLAAARNPLASSARRLGTVCLIACLTVSLTVGIAFARRGGGFGGGGHAGSMGRGFGPSGSFRGGGHFTGGHFGGFPGGRFQHGQRFHSFAHRSFFFPHRHGFHGFVLGFPLAVPYPYYGYAPYPYFADPYCDPYSPWYNPSYCYWRYRVF